MSQRVKDLGKVWLERDRMKRFLLNVFIEITAKLLSLMHKCSCLDPGHKDATGWQPTSQPDVM